MYDYRQQAIASEFSGHNSPIQWLHALASKEMLLSVDTSGLVNLWDKRNLQHSLQLQLPPASTFSLSHTNQLLAISGTTLYSVNLGSQTVDKTVEVRIYVSIYLKLPFAPSLFVPFEDSHYLMSNGMIVQLIDSAFHPGASYSHFSHVVDLGIHGKNMLTPIVEANECLLHVSGLFFNLISDSIPSTEETCSVEDQSILTTIRNASIPVDPLSPASISLLDSLISDSVICESDGDQVCIQASSEGSLVVSEGSTMEEEPRKTVMLTSPLATHQKAYMARLSQSVVKSAIHSSSTPRLSVIPPRPTVSRPGSTLSHSPAISHSSTLPSPPAISHQPSLPSSSSVNRTSIQSTRTIQTPQTSSSHSVLATSNQSVISTLSRRRTIINRLLRNQEYWKVIDSITDPVLICTCIDVMQERLVPTKSEEYLVVSNILKRCFESDKTKSEMIGEMINSVILSGLRLLRRVLIREPKNGTFGKGFVTMVDKLTKSSFSNDLVKFYLQECSQLLLS